MDAFRPEEGACTCRLTYDYVNGILVPQWPTGVGSVVASLDPDTPRAHRTPPDQRRVIVMTTLITHTVMVLADPPTPLNAETEGHV
jgi:hypothetical protein